MTVGRSSPPKLALWWLLHICRSQHKEALAGDLVERFQEGATRIWFWRQVVIACCTSFLGQIRRWSLFCYAIAGTAAICLIPASVLNPVSTWLHWSNLPWPLSQFIFELSAPAIVTMVVLVILAGGLAIERSFRWVFLLQTWFINLALITFGHFAIDAVPGLFRPVPGDPLHKMLIIPAVIQILLLAATFFIAAWVGCPAERNTESRKSPQAPTGEASQCK